MKRTTKRALKELFESKQKLIIGLIALILVFSISLLFGGDILDGFLDEGSHISSTTLESIPEWDSNVLRRFQK